MAIEEQNNRDLRATLALSQEEARNGTTRTLTLSGGRFVTVTIPAAAYEGQEIRLEGQGQAVGEQPPGALILTIAIASPENSSPPVLHEDANSATLLTHLSPPPPPSGAQSSYPGAATANSYPYSYYPPQGEPQYHQQQQQNYVQYGQQTPYTTGTPYTPPRSKPRSPALMIALITLIILVLGVSIPIYYVTILGPQQAAAQATSTAVAKVAGTAAVNATSTAQVVGTAQAQASATATVIASHQAKYDQITSGTPVLDDPMQNATLYNWDTGTGCAFTNGEYHVTIAQKNVFLYCAAESTNYSNFLYQVQMKIVNGDFGGIIFRADTTNTKFYLFRIGQDGTYDLYYYPDKEGTHAKNLLSGNSSLILTGANQNNLIAAVANNNTIDLYINKKYLISVNDPSLNSGKIGVIAQGGANAADVVYTHAQVWTL
ncbi:MAG TPA: DnaJ C-terminal domain-containing protein [Ktedonobacteraceae bacterium]|nr:DnaJ C-terminal domain-containing protein [Ktedonobacteraceae bacterium]